MCLALDTFFFYIFFGRSILPFYRKTSSENERMTACCTHIFFLSCARSPSSSTSDCMVGEARRCDPDVQRLIETRTQPLKASTASYSLSPKGSTQIDQKKKYYHKGKGKMDVSAEFTHHCWDQTKQETVANVNVRGGRACFKTRGTCELQEKRLLFRGFSGFMSLNMDHVHSRGERERVEGVERAASKLPCPVLL